MPESPNSGPRDRMRLSECAGYLQIVNSAIVLLTLTLVIGRAKKLFHQLSHGYILIPKLIFSERIQINAFRRITE